MRLLFDTHCFLWWIAEPERLPSAVIDALRSPQSELYLSAASAWEVRIKTQLGRLMLSEPWERLVEREVSENGLHLLPITVMHTDQLITLEPLHRDPFDRMLMAQSKAETMRLVSGDSWIHEYPDIDILWK